MEDNDLASVAAEVIPVPEPTPEPAPDPQPVYDPGLVRRMADHVLRLGMVQQFMTDPEAFLRHLRANAHERHDTEWHHPEHDYAHDKLVRAVLHERSVTRGGLVEYVPVTRAWWRG
jgi:hypothetical protein